MYVSETELKAGANIGKAAIYLYIYVTIYLSICPTSTSSTLISNAINEEKFMGMRRGWGYGYTWNASTETTET